MAWVAVGVTAMTFAQGMVAAEGQEAMGGVQRDAYRAQGVREFMAAIENAKVVRRRGRESQAEVTAAYAGAGVRVDTGTPVDVLSREYADVENDATQAILQGTRRRSQLNAQGDFASQGAEVAAANTRGEAVGNVLAESYGVYDRMRTAGWFTRQPRNGAPINAQYSPVPNTRIA